MVICFIHVNVHLPTKDIVITQKNWEKFETAGKIFAKAFSEKLAFALHGRCSWWVSLEWCILNVELRYFEHSVPSITADCIIFNFENCVNRILSKLLHLLRQANQAAWFWSQCLSPFFPATWIKQNKYKLYLKNSENSLYTRLNLVKQVLAVFLKSF